MKLSSFNIKKFFIFSEKKAVLIFHETEPAPIETPYILGKGIYLYFRK